MENLLRILDEGAFITSEEMAELAKEVRALQQDALRYRWLTKNTSKLFMASEKSLNTQMDIAMYGREGEMKKQKFFRGDLVQIADDLGASMRHFDKGCQAIVMGTYAELCSDDNDVDNYQLYILPNKGSCFWYHTHQLTLIEPNRYDLLPKNNRTRLNWEAQQERDAK